jgi:hypothetical protein
MQHLFFTCPSYFDWEENKREFFFIAFNKSFGTSSMKWHVEFEHFKLLITYVTKVFAIETLGVHNQWLMKVVGHVWNLPKNAQK